MAHRLFEGKEHATSYWKYRVSPSAQLIEEVMSFLKKKVGVTYMFHRIQKTICLFLFSCNMYSMSSNHIVTVCGCKIFSMTNSSAEFNYRIILLHVLFLLFNVLLINWTVSCLKKNSHILMMSHTNV
jgi:hypothetical protein